MNQEKKAFKRKGNKEIKFGYYLNLPKGYSNERNEKWPLIVFLHGAGERGNGKSELKRVKTHGLAEILEFEESIPCIVLSPQCPEDSFWVVQVENLNYLVDEIIETCNVDKKRIYLTGLSMGGYGTWIYAMAYPNKFAAIAPVCGGGMPWNAAVLKDMPIWAFHGEKDSIVSYIETQNMVNALKGINENVKFTIYPLLDHACWTETYSNKELYKWLLSNSKS